MKIENKPNTNKDINKRNDTERKGDEDYLHFIFSVFLYYLRIYNTNTNRSQYQLKLQDKDTLLSNINRGKKREYMKKHNCFKSNTHTHIYISQVHS